MISGIIFSELERSQKFGYAKKLDFFKRNKKISFNSGLNILFAPNGTGKSTIIDMLAYATASKQGGISTLTNRWALDMTLERTWGDDEQTFLAELNLYTMVSLPRTAMLVRGLG